MGPLQRIPAPAQRIVYQTVDTTKEGPGKKKHLPLKAIPEPEPEIMFETTYYQNRIKR